MLAIPRCFERRCKHYGGVEWKGKTEATETNVCPAFPDGIPAEIAYGTNKHLKPEPKLGQKNDVVFEKADK